jgi:hypothetical protein
MNLVKIYKYLNKYDSTFKELLFKNILSDNQYDHFITKKGKNFILNGNKICKSIKDKYLARQIVEPDDYKHKKWLKEKINHLISDNKIKFISALLSKVTIEEIDEEINKFLKRQTASTIIINHTGGLNILEKIEDTGAKFIINTPQWKIGLRSRFLTPNLPFDKSNVEIKYNAKNKSGIIKFRNLFYSHSYFSAKKSKETKVTLRSIAINDNKIGLFIHVKTYRYNRHFGSNSADYNVGFYFDVLDNKIILSKTKRPKNFEEFLNILKKEGNKNEQRKRKNTNKNNELQRGSNRIMEGSKDKKAVQVCNRKTA